MKYIFVSDIHLGHPDNKYDIKFESFLKAVSYDRLIIVGDLYDLYFMTENEIKEKYAKVYNIIDKGMQDGSIIYIRGNHDFCLSSPYSIYPTHKISLGNKRLLITHGHLQAIERKLYPILKILYKIGYLQKFFKFLFQFDRNIILDKIFHMFTEAGVPDGALFLKARMIEDLGECYDYIVCGHTHMPEVSDKYINCGDWLTRYSYIEYTDDKGFSLKYFQDQMGND